VLKYIHPKKKYTYQEITKVKWFLTARKVYVISKVQDLFYSATKNVLKQW